MLLHFLLRMVCGSCEVEAFSACDLRIPYSAIMGVYETKDAITMVHSYSRTYSQIEVEDGRQSPMDTKGAGFSVTTKFAPSRLFTMVPI